MRLWQYLKSKMLSYRDRQAFSSGTTYADLLELEECQTEQEIILCEGQTKEEQALIIMKCIASGNIAVPIDAHYGTRNNEYIRGLISRANEEDLRDVALIMFTSGTTGSPKGVMLTDENIITNLEAISTYFDLNGMRTICIYRSLVHISALTGELLYALCNGLTIHFYEETFIPQRMLRYFLNEGIDVFCGTPTLYCALAKANQGKETMLKVGAISGEVLSQTTSALISESFPNVHFYNVYGLTEHAPRVSALSPMSFNRKRGSVGRPIGDVSLKIVNGELLVQSKSIMKGYYLDANQSKEKIQNGWLHTGDRAHFDKDGYLYIDGRIDNLLIHAGINVYPEEIEEAAKSISGIDDCVVYLEGVGDNRVLCMDYNGKLQPVDLRKKLASLLNVSILPRKIRRVEEIPKSLSGKKCRR